MKKKNSLRLSCAWLITLSFLSTASVTIAAQQSATPSDVKDNASANESRELEDIKSRVKSLEAELVRQSGSSVDEKEQPADKAKAGEQQEKPVKLGGALRFSYYTKDFDENIKTRRGDIGFDIFRINADGKFDNLFFSAEYRFYSYMSTIHHGYAGYRFDDSQQLQGGITKVPFGLLPYAAHNFWFGVPYYLGLGDDYDSGLKYINQPDAWDLRLAFFKNAELGDASNLKRYSYDPVTTGAAANEETNTFNARAAYTFNKGTGCEHEAGISAQWGQLYNTDTTQKGDRWAGAAHVDSHCGRWNFQLQTLRYGFNPENPAGVSDDIVTLGAFTGTHDIAADGNVYVLNVAYNVPVPWSGVKLLTCYNDYSVLAKDTTNFANSYLNTSGCLVNIGPTYTYIDIIRARNMVFFDDGSLAGGGSDDWHTRFNINFGIYW
ncbi:MAG: hypothetical protein PVH04_10370 [Gammaproteobacteria bacterium]|jgi:hypothetical protein